MTDDGSNGHKGFVTAALEDNIKNGANYDFVVAIGPLPMMRAVCNLTKEYNIETMISMNPIMIDGTGMCGGCRLTVGGKTKFACVDGPDFNGHEVDFDEAMKRLRTYREQEQEATREFNCRLMEGAKMPNMTPKRRRCQNRRRMSGIRNFEEVALGYTDEMAIEEAQRCLNCKHKPCVNGCPVGVPIPDFIAHVAKGELEEAYTKP